MIHVAADGAAAAEAAARLVVTYLGRRAAHSDAPVFFALSGGSTPRALYERLAGPRGDALPWERVHLLWGDERCVPADDPRSNYGMVRKTGLLSLPFGGIHRMPGELPSEEGASAYERELRGLFPGREFPAIDLVLLGLGEDAHVASLFPASEALSERHRWVTVSGPYQGTRRLTLTLPVLASAGHLLFLVSGSSKAAAVCSTLARRAPVSRDSEEQDRATAPSPPARLLLQAVDERGRAGTEPADTGGLATGVGGTGGAPAGGGVSGATPAGGGGTGRMGSPDGQSRPSVSWILDGPAASLWEARRGTS